MDKEERQKALDRIARARQHHEEGSDVASQADSTITTSVALEEEKEEDEMVNTDLLASFSFEFGIAREWSASSLLSLRIVCLYFEL